MEQTDRQTDKASHWKSAIFETDDNWSKLDTLPTFVKRLHRQKEICPTTQRPHFQIHVECVRQVRLKQMTGWIKATKWSAVLGSKHIENSIKYCSKSESAVAGTHEVKEGQRYYQTHELLLEIAKFIEFEDPIYWSGKHSMNTWGRITSRMIKSDITWANKLCNPALRRMWDDWQFAFVGKVSEYLEETGGAFIIEAPPEPSEAPGEDEDPYSFLED